MSRLEDIRHFYKLMDVLSGSLGGSLRLGECHGRMKWPKRGVYFFFDENLKRSDGDGPRAIRVGTHALTDGSGSTLWGRLSQHAGRIKTGAGNHRGSIFRLLVGEAIKARDGMNEPVSWGVSGSRSEAAKRLGFTSEEISNQERVLEQMVSSYIRALPFLFVAVEDPPGAGSERGTIERGSIALLSNYHRDEIDPPTADWLGLRSSRERVRASGLWNNNHVDELPDPKFLAVLERTIGETQPARF